MLGQTGDCGEKLLVCLSTFTHETVETGKSPASRAALFFSGRQSDDDPARILAR
jgi:hypothetical protein